MKKIIKLFILLIILIIIFLNLNKKTTLNIIPNISKDYLEIEGIVSNNAIVLEKSTNTIFMGKNYDEKIHPASMTKVMTAIIAIENCKSLNGRTFITQDIIDYCNKNGLSLSGFKAGDNPKLIDLLYGTLLESGAESSIALARHIGVDEDDFIDLMNDKAVELSMLNTHFSNSTGMTDYNNFSSTKDIAILFNYALKNKTFRKIIYSKNHKVNGRLISNTLFFKRANLGIDKNFIECGKTGYTEAAGLCLVSQGNIDKNKYIVVVANANGNAHTQQFNLIDTEKIYLNLKNH